MNTGQLEERYFQRMDSALADKLRILDHLAPSARLVADVGAGSGSLAVAIAAHTGANVYAIDSNPESVARIAVLASQEAANAISAGLTPPEITPVAGSFDFLREAPAAGQYDSVVCCSVLHEAYSYGGGPEGIKADRRASWEQAVLDAATALRPGGKLVIRDGVAPRDPLRHAVLVARTENDAVLVQHYLDALPQGSSRRLKQLDWRVATQKNGHEFTGMSWEGSAVAVAEALITLNWLDSPDPAAGVQVDEVQLAREAHETYMLATRDGYARRIAQVAASVGIELVLEYSDEYVQDGYVAHVGPRFGAYATPEGKPWNEQLEPWFPSTNAIWAFTKK